MTETQWHKISKSALNWIFVNWLSLGREKKPTPGDNAYFRVFQQKGFLNGSLSSPISQDLNPLDSISLVIICL